MSYDYPINLIFGIMFTIKSMYSVISKASIFIKRTRTNYPDPQQGRKINT